MTSGLDAKKSVTTTFEHLKRSVTTTFEHLKRTVHDIAIINLNIFISYIRTTKIYIYKYK